MKRLFFIIFSVLIGTSAYSQSKDAEFDKMLDKLIDFNVPTITVDQLKAKQKRGKVYLLDAREASEYNVSHLPDAKRVGYDDFKLSSVKHIPKSATIVIYCTVGYRSGKVVEKLRKAGYTKVYNLHGSIFEWVNQGNKVVNSKGQTTTRVHTYSKEWAKWLKRGKKVY
jgi:rhodanese-related sulfurtransferase